MWGNLEPRGLGVLGGGVQGSPTRLIFIFCLFAWVGAVLWSCFLTSPARRVGEVRKCLAERLGRHPPRPAAVAAVMRGAQWPYGRAGERAGTVRLVYARCEAFEPEASKRRRTRCRISRTPSGSGSPRSNLMRKSPGKLC